MEESVKLAIVISVPLWSAMAVIVSVTGYFAGIDGLGISFAVVFFATIFWMVTITKVLGGDSEPRKYRSADIESRLAVIEDRLNQIITSRKE